VGAIYGGGSMWKQTDDLKRGVDIVVATPGRLMDMMNRGAISFKELRCIVLD
jgi:superfamily II DNA/RNA helicase